MPVGAGFDEAIGGAAEASEGAAFLGSLVVLKAAWAFGLEKGHEFGDEDEWLRHTRPFTQGPHERGTRMNIFFARIFVSAGHHADDRRDGLNKRTGRISGSMVGHFEDF